MAISVQVGWWELLHRIWRFKPLFLPSGNSGPSWDEEKQTPYHVQNGKYNGKANTESCMHREGEDLGKAAENYRHQAKFYS